MISLQKNKPAPLLINQQVSLRTNIF